MNYYLIEKNGKNEIKTSVLENENIILELKLIEKRYKYNQFSNVGNDLYIDIKSNDLYNCEYELDKYNYEIGMEELTNLTKITKTTKEYLKENYLYKPMNIKKDNLLKVAKRKHKEGYIFLCKDKQYNKDVINKIYPKDCCIAYIYKLLKEKFNVIELISYQDKNMIEYVGGHEIIEYFKTINDSVQKRVFVILLKEYGLYDKGKINKFKNLSYTICKENINNKDIINICDLISKFNSMNVPNVESAMLNIDEQGYNIYLLYDYFN